MICIYFTDFMRTSVDRLKSEGFSAENYLVKIEENYDINDFKRVISEKRKFLFLHVQTCNDPFFENVRVIILQV